MAEEPIEQRLQNNSELDPIPQQLPAEPVGSSEATPTETTTPTATLEDEFKAIETGQQAPSPQSSPSSVVKKVVGPPKRLLTTASKRLSTVTGTKSTASPGTTARGSSSTTSTAGGLSKPPARPPVSSSRRTATGGGTASVATAASGHRSQPSTSSTDGDKSKKPIGSAPKRMSMAPATTLRSPASKPASTADRRSTITPGTAPGSGSSSTATRKPALPSTARGSSTTASTRGAPITTRTRTTTTRPSTITSGTASRATSGKVIPGGGTQAKTLSASDQEHIKRLEAERDEMEKRMEEMKKSIQDGSSEERRSGGLDPEHLNLQETVKEREARIAELEKEKVAQEQETASLNKVTKEAHEKELADLQDSWHDKIETLKEVLENEKASHTGALESLQKGIESEKESTSSLTAQLAERTSALGITKESLAQAESDAKTEKDAYESLLEARDSEIKGNAQVIDQLKSEVQKSHGSRKALEARLSDAKAAVENSEKASASKINEAQQAAASTVTSLEERLEKQEKANLEDKKALTNSQEELAGLKKVMDAFDQESKDKENQHAAAITKAKAELDAKVKEISTLAIRHDTVIKNMGDDHAAEFEALESTMENKHKKQLEELQEKHNSALKSLDEKDTSHSSEIDTLRAEHAKSLAKVKSDQNAQSALRGDSEKKTAAELAALKSQHEDVVGKLEAEMASLKAESDSKLEKAKLTHQKEIESIQANLASEHSKEIDSLQQKHNASTQDQLEALEQTHSKKLASIEAKSSDASKLQAEHEGALAKLKTEIDANRAELASAQKQTKSDEAHLKTSKAEFAALKTESTASQEKLTAELNNAKTQLASTQAEFSSSQKQTSTENEEMIKKLRAESTSVKVELERAKSQREDTSALEKRYTDEIEGLNTSLARDKETIATLTAELSKAQAEAKASPALEKEVTQTKEELKVAKENADRDISDMNQVFAKQIETFQREADTLNEHNKSLKEQLASEQKLKDQLQAQLGAGKGLASSKWAGDGTEGEERVTPSKSAGTMAALRRQVESLKELNSEAKEENQRMLEELSPPEP
ncbi:MAG: hypothetical protein M1814_003473 [Vezdaea aestivalis]|nr:MAG: hypothetical protein M1814_003473 [Vezdaea aestivalis]